MVARRGAPCRAATLTNSARRYVGDPPSGIRADRVAEEVAQGAWTRGWERQSQLQSDAALVPWINSIALNALRGFLRRQTRAPQFPEEGQESIVADERISLSDRCDLKRILDRCTRMEQELLWAYWGEGFTSKEIAAQLGIKPVSVRVRIGRLARSLDEIFAAPVPPPSIQ